MTEDEMWAGLVARWVPDDPFPADEQAELYYRIKYRIAAQLPPITSIVEIGVRAGYSAYAFLAAQPQARYMGIDADQGEWGGEAGYFDRARTVLQGFAVDFLRADSQRLRALPADYDFAHIDGDHSYLGTLHDLNLCAASCPFLLVDDYDFISTVRAAVNEFIVRNRWGYHYVPDHGFRGNMVLRDPHSLHREPPTPQSKDDREGIRIAQALKAAVEG